MRVHKGFLYIYDDDGCFLPFGGIPPEAVLHRVHGFFVSLEGIFRRMKPEITRKANSVVRSIAADMQNYEAEAEYLEACRDATTKRIDTPAYPPRLDDDMSEVMEEREREPKARGRKQAPEVGSVNTGNGK